MKENSKYFIKYLSLFIATFIALVFFNVPIFASSLILVIVCFLLFCKPIHNKRAMALYFYLFFFYLAYIFIANIAYILLNNSVDIRIAFILELISSNIVAMALIFPIFYISSAICYYFFTSEHRLVAESFAIKSKNWQVILFLLFLSLAINFMFYFETALSTISPTIN